MKWYTNSLCLSVVEIAMLDIDEVDGGNETVVDAPRDEGDQLSALDDGNCTFFTSLSLVLIHLFYM